MFVDFELLFRLILRRICDLFAMHGTNVLFLDFAASYNCRWDHFWRPGTRNELRRSYPGCWSNIKVSFHTSYEKENIKVSFHTSALKRNTGKLMWCINVYRLEASSTTNRFVPKSVSSWRRWWCESCWRPFIVYVLIDSECLATLNYDWKLRYSLWNIITISFS